jgi:hypothetical protein
MLEAAVRGLGDRCIECVAGRQSAEPIPMLSRKNIGHAGMPMFTRRRHVCGRWRLKGYMVEAHHLDVPLQLVGS